jgi:hypothetical protein
VRHSLFRLTLAVAHLAIVGLFALFIPTAFGQNVESTAPTPHVASRTWEFDLSNWKFSPSTASKFVPSVVTYRFDSAPQPSSFLLAKPLRIASPDTIEKMEAAFSCNDTPFIDQVRLPVAALWHGRVRLTGFESDVTTANFVLGLPGAGMLANLSLTGSGHLATHAPPSDQLVGMHLTFSIGAEDTEALDNSGLHGLQYLARSGRTFFQTLLVR